MKKGLLLINLGTPDSTSVKDVRRYLRQFLSDPYVIDTNPIIRWLLLNLVILPTRPKQSAEAYRAIWTDKGSPLLLYSKALANNAQQLLSDEYKVALAMRYGNPSINVAIETLKECEQLTILPLFPQYSLAATETAIVQAKKQASQYWHKEQITVIRDFYAHEAFIACQAKKVQTVLIEKGLRIAQQEKVLDNTIKIIFSYHGVPVRQVEKVSDCAIDCASGAACPVISQKNKNCYRAQCYSTSRALATALDLKEDDYITSFQSRLGRIPWIKPYTDDTLPLLAKNGVKTLVVACPSFVCDCLETLEEIGIRANEQWRSLGGEALHLVPCVNEDAFWLKDTLKKT